MNKKEIAKTNSIQSRIHNIRGLQVMLDKDLAELYNVEVKILNQAVKRNSTRFPLEFMFQLTKGESLTLRSQFVTLENGKGEHRKYLPHVFTEQGIAMLSAVLRSEFAIKMSIQIINAFVSMRRFIASNALENKDYKPKQGIFFEGQIFDAYKFVSDLFRSAKKTLVKIDNYLDESVLIHIAKRRENIVYHFGASLKDLGKKWFAFSKMDIGAAAMLVRIEDLAKSKS